MESVHILDKAFEFIGLLAVDGTLLDANETALRYIGVTRDQVLGRPFCDTPWWAASDEGRNRLKDGIARAARGEFVRFQATHRSADGHVDEIDFSLTPVVDHSGIVTFLVPEGRRVPASPTTEDSGLPPLSMRLATRLQALAGAQATLSQIHARVIDVLDQMEEMVWSLAPDGRRTLYVNQAATRICGRAVSDILSHAACGVLTPHPEDAAAVEAWLRDVRATGTAQLTYRVTHADGSVRWLRDRARLVRNDQGHPVRIDGIAADVTEQLQAEQSAERRRLRLQERDAQLSRLASEVTLAEQEAREALAKTLHDNLQQILFSATLKLDRLARRLVGADAADLELLASARHEIGEAVATARSLSVELVPPMLHDSGLPTALVWLAKRTQEQYGIAINLSADPNANPDRRDVRTLLFESVRELVFNAVKHAHVRHVSVDLARGADGTIHITVADEGVGFDPNATLDAAKRDGPGLGLRRIRERLTLLGGRLDIRSGPGQGARFHLVSPTS